ncbi:hypothetical protein Q8F55_000743 [Vanrija albida]|uniref:PH domain-containing protein n=1 Tax=Vanrija albida TaxID=181172 RepID=A0ABR3QE50_9TREE
MAADTSDPALAAAVAAVRAAPDLSPADRISWLVSTYAEGSANALVLYGSGGPPPLPSLAMALDEATAAEPVAFGYASVGGKGLVVVKMGKGVGAVRRAKAIVHSRAFAALFEYTALVTVTSGSELTDDLLKAKLGLDSLDDPAQDAGSHFVTAEGTPNPDAPQGVAAALLSQHAPLPSAPDTAPAPAPASAPPPPPEHSLPAGPIVDLAATPPIDTAPATFDLAPVPRSPIPSPAPPTLPATPPRLTPSPGSGSSSPRLRDRGPTPPIPARSAARRASSRDEPPPPIALPPIPESSAARDMAPSISPASPTFGTGFPVAPRLPGELRNLHARGPSLDPQAALDALTAHLDVPAPGPPPVTPPPPEPTIVEEPEPAAIDPPLRERTVSTSSRGTPRERVMSGDRPRLRDRQPSDRPISERENSLEPVPESAPLATTSAPPPGIPPPVPEHDVPPTPVDTPPRHSRDFRDSDSAGTENRLSRDSAGRTRDSFGVSYGDLRRSSREPLSGSDSRRTSDARRVSRDTMGVERERASHYSAADSRASMYSAPDSRASQYSTGDPRDTRVSNSSDPRDTRASHSSDPRVSQVSRTSTVDSRRSSRDYDSMRRASGSRESYTSSASLGKLGAHSIGTPRRLSRDIAQSPIHHRADSHSAHPPISSASALHRSSREALREAFAAGAGAGFTRSAIPRRVSRERLNSAPERAPGTPNRGSLNTPPIPSTFYPASPSPLPPQQPPPSVPLPPVPSTSPLPPRPRSRSSFGRNGPPPSPAPEVPLPPIPKAIPASVLAASAAVVGSVSSPEPTSSAQMEPANPESGTLGSSLLPEVSPQLRTSPASPLAEVLRSPAPVPITIPPSSTTPATPSTPQSPTFGSPTPTKPGVSARKPPPPVDAELLEAERRHSVRLSKLYQLPDAAAGTTTISELGSNVTGSGPGTLSSRRAADATSATKPSPALSDDATRHSVPLSPPLSSPGAFSDEGPGAIVSVAAGQLTPAQVATARVVDISNGSLTPVSEPIEKFDAARPAKITTEAAAPSVPGPVPGPNDANGVARPVSKDRANVPATDDERVPIVPKPRKSSVSEAVNRARSNSAAAVAAASAATSPNLTRSPLPTTHQAPAPTSLLERGGSQTSTKSAKLRHVFRSQRSNGDLRDPSSEFGEFSPPSSDQNHGTIPPSPSASRLRTASLTKVFRRKKETPPASPAFRGAGISSDDIHPEPIGLGFTLGMHAPSAYRTPSGGIGYTPPTHKQGGAAPLPNMSAEAALFSARQKSLAAHNEAHELWRKQEEERKAKTKASKSREDVLSQSSHSPEASVQLSSPEDAQPTQVPDPIRVPDVAHQVEAIRRDAAPPPVPEKNGARVEQITAAASAARRHRKAARDSSEESPPMPNVEAEAKAARAAAERAEAEEAARLDEERQLREAKIASRVAREAEAKARAAAKAEAQAKAEEERKSRAEQEAAVRAEQLGEQQRRRELAAARAAEVAARDAAAAKAREESRAAQGNNGSAGPVLLRGWVTVQTMQSMTWRRRYFHLLEHELQMFKTDHEARPITVATLSAAAKVSHTYEESQVQGSWKLRSASGEEYFMFADSAEDKETILHALTAAITAA